MAKIDQNAVVGVTSIIPGIGATNLGKAIDSAVGATDTGIALLAKHNSDTVHLTTAEGDYDILRLANFGGLQVAPEQHHIIDSMNATTGWSALGNDTLNLATTKKHILGTDALTFDKVDGAANTIFAGIAKTISSVDLGKPSPHDLIQTACYIPNIDDVSYVFIRLGTDSSHYNEWRIEDTALTAAIFETLLFNVGDASYAGITGNGWDPSAVTYVAIGVAFDAETNELAEIIFDELSFHTNQHTSAELNAEVSSSVSSAKVDLQKINGSVVDKGSGNKSNGSQRIVVATDDVNLSAIKSAIENLENDYTPSYHATAGANKVIKNSAGFLHAIGVGTSVASSVIEVSDHASDGDGNVKIYLAGDTIGPAVYPVNMTMSSGITVDITNQTHCTFIYK